MDQRIENVWGWGERKVEKEHEELEDLYKTFNPAPVEEESKEESKPKGRPRKN